MSTAIEIRDITKTYPPQGAQPAMTAVDHVSLSIEPGELFFLLGPSGCGKTTLLRMIAGFIEPTSGRILFNGRDVTNDPPNTRNTGMVFQSYALWPHMTVAANVAFGLKIRNTPAAEAAARVRDALAAVQMEPLSERKPNQLSGGQQQRVALARAIVIRPDVLLLDEPLSNLDAKLRNELRSEIRRICKSAGITTVYVTHDQREALTMADRLAVFHFGKLVQVGTPEDLYSRPTTKFVAGFIGETNIVPVIEAKPCTSGFELRTAVGVERVLSDTQPIAVSIRPESVRVVLNESGHASVETTEYLGSHCVVKVKIGDLSLTGVAGSEFRSTRHGDKCEVVIASGAYTPLVG